MPETSNSANSSSSFFQVLFSIFKRPLEFGLIGAAIVLVLHLANTADILPKVFKGAGIEIEFREDQKKIVQATIDTAGGVDEIKLQVSELQSEIRLLKSDIVKLSGNRVQVNASRVSQPIESKQDIAITSRQLVSDKEVVDGSGVIWIGTYDPERETWTETSFLSGTDISPYDLTGQKLQLTSDVNVREELPANNSSYFSKVKALGVASKGMQVAVIDKPQRYDRENGIQYWAEVSLQYKPYIGVE